MLSAGAFQEPHVYMHLGESAGFNKEKPKCMQGVPGNLVAFACRLSFQRGFEGNVSFVAKPQLINHPEKNLGAFHSGKRIMYEHESRFKPY